MIIKAGITPPAIYALGYPNANCIGCVKAASPTYWNLVRKTHPEVFEERAEDEQRIRGKVEKRVKLATDTTRRIRPQGNRAASCQYENRMRDILRGEGALTNQRLADLLGVKVCNVYAWKRGDQKISRYNKMILDLIRERRRC